MSLPFSASERTAQRMLIAFADFTRYTAIAARADDAAVADLLDEYYHRLWEHVARGGGRVVKFIGDGALVVFPEDRVDDGVLALLAAKAEVDGWFDARGYDARLIVKAHFGSAIAGPFGPAGAAQFDVIGNDVNIAATLATRSFALSAEAFRKLAPATRKRFKKHTPPVTYIRTEDRHPHRTGRNV